jgi:hypothetical protein
MPCKNKYNLYDVDLQGHHHPTGKSVELLGTGTNEVVAEVFKLYGFTQYYTYYRSVHYGDKIEVSYDYGQGHKATWVLIKA